VQLPYKGHCATIPVCITACKCRGEGLVFPCRYVCGLLTASLQPSVYCLRLSIFAPGGDVPGLFTPEELAKDLAPLEKIRDTDQAYMGPPQLHPYFLYRLKQHLRVAVSLNPDGEWFRLRCEANPALLSRCCVLWWSGWDEDSCRRLAVERTKV
jgi:hypothetical protein